MMHADKYTCMCKHVYETSFCPVRGAHSRDSFELFCEKSVTGSGNCRGNALGVGVGEVEGIGFSVQGCEFRFKIKRFRFEIGVQVRGMGWRGSRVSALKHL